MTTNKSKEPYHRSFSLFAFLRYCTITCSSNEFLLTVDLVIVAAQGRLRDPQENKRRLISLQIYHHCRYDSHFSTANDGKWRLESVSAWFQSSFTIIAGTILISLPLMMVNGAWIILRMIEPPVVPLDDRRDNSGKNCRHKCLHLTNSTNQFHNPTIRCLTPLDAVHLWFCRNQLVDFNEDLLRKRLSVFAFEPLSGV